MSAEHLELFRQRVLEDVALQAQLREIVDRDTFVRQTVQLGVERGYTFTPAEVDEALKLQQRAWLERWL